MPEPKTIEEREAAIAAINEQVRARVRQGADAVVEVLLRYDGPTADLIISSVQWERDLRGVIQSLHSDPVGHASDAENQWDLAPRAARPVFG